MEATEPKSEEESWFEVEGERDTTESVGSALKTDRREYVFPAKQPLKLIKLLITLITRVLLTLLNRRILMLSHINSSLVLPLR